MADLSTDLERALSPNYRIIRELGGGGMSRVFLAEERALEREVVIKVLPPELAVGVSVERFKREMQLAARLQHPHIVPILSTGSIGDVLFYIMPFIKGESLRARLARDVALPVDESARILREVADALSFAHGQGVVHRDIKPDNVLLTSGHALVTDFGVAKALGVGDSGTEGEASGLTSLGMALGTPTYMAPEQAAADPHVDHRADLYALGVMAYEMLAGQPPFVAPTPQALIAAHFSKVPESLRVARNAVPEAFDELVMRCLAKQPADRVQRASDLLPVLDHLAHVSSSTGATRPIPSAVTATAMASPSPRARPRSRIRTTSLIVGGGVAATTLAWLLWSALGLPDWVLWSSVALVAIGVPVLLRAANRRDAAANAGPIPQLNSVRGALRAGGFAFLALGTITGAVVGMRAMGIGPFATLLSAGTLSERDRIVVAEFGNTTPDSLLGQALTEALTIDLSQSKVIRLMTPAELVDALGRMQRDAKKTRLSADVATEVAAREGAKVVIAGDIAPFASGYTVSARILDPQGATLYATRASANGAADILPALEKVSRKIREEIGESLKSIRGTQSLERVSTSSLEALQLYTRATRSKARGDDDDRLSMYQQAVALDSSFAMAWRGIYAEMVNNRGDAAALQDAVEQMVRHKDRLPPREALHVDAVVAQRSGKYDEAIEIFRRIVTSWPEDAQARNGLGLYLRATGRYAESEAVYSPVVRNGTGTISVHYNLVTTQIPQERFAAAESTLALVYQRFPTSPQRWQIAYFLAASKNQFDWALGLADSLTTAGTGYRYWGNLFKAEVHSLQGQLVAADRAVRGAMRAQLDQRNPGGALQEELSGIWIAHQLVGDTVATRARLDAAFAQTPIDSLPLASRPYGDAVRLRAAVGQVAEARRLIAEYERVLPPSLRSDDGRMNRGRAQLALAENRLQEAVTFSRAGTRNCGACASDLLGESFEKLGMTDSAIVVYERALKPPAYGSDFRNWRPGVVPRALYRLGALYEQRGERQRARDRYAALLDLWQKADPSLQSAVSAVRDRHRALAGEAPARR